MDIAGSDLSSLDDRMVDARRLGNRLSVKLTILASQNPSIAVRATAIANDTCFVANVISQLGELLPQKVYRCNGETGIINAKGASTISSYTDSCTRVFDTIDCEFDIPLNKSRGFQVVDLPGAAEGSFMGARMDQLRLELKEAKEALMLVLQVSVLAYSRISPIVLVYPFARLSTPFLHYYSGNEPYFTLFLSKLLSVCVQLSLTPS